MKSSSYFLIIAILFGSITLGNSIDAGAALLPKSAMFKVLEEKLATAKAGQAHILVPEKFADALEYYQSALEKYEDKDDYTSVQDTIDKAIRLLDQITRENKIATVFFADTLAAREDALKVDGPQINADAWKETEELFKDAAETLEDGDSNDAKQNALKATQQFREIELKAIQTKYLKKTWSLLQQAENTDVEKFAPLTLHKARELAKKSAALLHLHRYEQEEAAQLARRAEYEVTHAMDLAKRVQAFKQSDQTVESIMLAEEEILNRIADQMALSIQFDHGVAAPTQSIIDSVNALQSAVAKLKQDMKNEKQHYEQLIAQKDKDLVELQNQLDTLEKRLSHISSTKDTLEQQLDQARIKKEKIERIRASFLPDEGHVLLDQDKVIIRLWGVTFPRGKAVIEPQYFGLLTKVKNAFAEFPNCRITIEGHTDAVGSEETNQALSEARAEAVRQYILANSNIPSYRIESVGYGESRPVANNETSEGQAKNRRIDIVIQP